MRRIKVMEEAPSDTMAEEELHNRLRNVNLNRAEMESNGPNIVEAPNLNSNFRIFGTRTKPNFECAA
uniref:Uncharacterized protein n=1 Tax=Globodera pallida TaxID=36090 RepID=A0A183BJ99_GLOPA